MPYTATEYDTYTISLSLYCKILHFRCILISRFWNVEISLHFNLASSQRFTSIYQAFDGQTEFLQVYNFVILSYSQNSRKFHACKNMLAAYYKPIHKKSCKFVQFA